MNLKLINVMYSLPTDLEKENVLTAIYAKMWCENLCKHRNEESEQF